MNDTTHAADQGLTPMLDALTENEIAHQLVNTGGDCMVIEIARGDRVLSITRSESDEGWMILDRDPTDQDDYDVLAEDATLTDALALLQD